MTDYTYDAYKNKQRNHGYSSLTDLALSAIIHDNDENDIESSSSQQQAMKESFLHRQDPSSLPIAASRPMMEVVAPADLPEGYEFQVVAVQHQQQQEVFVGNNGSSSSSALSSLQTCKVRVPPGGVEQGQTFLVPYPNITTTTTDLGATPPSSTMTTTTTTTTKANTSIPVGHWRDSLFSCFQYGICHPHCWTSWCCTFLATGQVIRRMKLDWTGHPTDDRKRQMHAFCIILGLVVGYFVLHIGLSIVSQLLDPNAGHVMDITWEEQEMPRSYYWVNILYNNIGWTYWIVSTLILIRTRHSVRERYSIPAGHAAEDVVCSICCHCCVAGQLLRHTTNYDVYPSVIFTDTGLPPHVPAIV